MSAKITDSFFGNDSAEPPQEHQVENSTGRKISCFFLLFQLYFSRIQSDYQRLNW